MSIPEADLIARVLVNDDRYAFGELVKAHQSALRLFLRRLTRGNHALADDLAQETLIEAYRKLGRFKGEARFSTWLLGIAFNRFRQYQRRQGPETYEVPVSDEAFGITEEHGSSVGLRTDLKSALGQLRSEEQLALQLCYQEGLSHEEAACVLACPLGTLKTHLLRAKARLRHWLAAYAP